MHSVGCFLNLVAGLINLACGGNLSYPIPTNPIAVSGFVIERSTSQRLGGRGPAEGAEGGGATFISRASAQTA